LEDWNKPVFFLLEFINILIVFYAVYAQDNKFSINQKKVLQIFWLKNFKMQSITLTSILRVEVAVKVFLEKACGLENFRSEYLGLKSTTRDYCHHFSFKAV